MKTKMFTVLAMTMILGGSAFAVGMPQTINNDRDLKHALKAAKTPEDHQRIADYCQAKADNLKAKAMGYEQAAQSLRGTPLAKNTTAPNTPARYEALAKELRTEAQSNEQLAASNEQMARVVTRASK